MYKVTFFGLEKTFNSLLPAMEARQAILSTQPDVYQTPEVWERDGDTWRLFDAEKFLSGLRVLLAPAE